MALPESQVVIAPIEKVAQLSEKIGVPDEENWVCVRAVTSLGELPRLFFCVRLTHQPAVKMHYQGPAARISIIVAKDLLGCGGFPSQEALLYEKAMIPKESRRRRSDGRRGKGEAK